MLLYQTGKFIYVTQSSGQFMGKDNGKTLNIVMQGLTAFLIVPVGDILMIQLIILIMAIIGIMIANFFFEFIFA